ncbi:MAG: haloacid dehalogenase-like hydrolase [Leptotrichiaceae bacterium]|nr:haloacid dehalogenase-like hydrolase [Leptotrichiaceae bacterium]
MSKRLLSCFASDFEKMTKDELKLAIKASEGRTVLSENIVTQEPFAHGITNSEVARAFGADLILLNTFNVNKPFIWNLPETDEPVKLLKKLIGRPVGVNLEPVDTKARMLESVELIDEGRIAGESSLKKADDLGFDFICLTGNPATGVTNKEIANAVKLAKKHFSGLIIAGKMHGSGVDEAIVNLETIDEFINSGADIIMIPAVGTVPGFTQNELIKAVKYIKKRNCLVMSAIGTSQESGRKELIREIALMNKIAGVDIQHTGDGSHSGISPYENIFELSLALRGSRHTVRMIAGSNAR